MKIRNQFILILAVFFAFSIVAKGRTQNVSNDKQPKVVKAVAPIYPPTAQALGEEGDVTVDVEINTKGDITSAKAISGHKFLKEVSIRTAKRWKFESTADKNLERKVQLVFNYKTVPKMEDSGIYFNPPYRIEIVSPEIQIQKYAGLPLKANKPKK